MDFRNTASPAPRKEYETNTGDQISNSLTDSRLTTGALQLAEGSHLIFAET
ncbi:hypothetical protein ACE6H2_024989 [Prunus campanulata]